VPSSPGIRRGRARTRRSMPPWSSGLSASRRGTAPQVPTSETREQMPFGSREHAVRPPSSPVIVTTRTLVPAVADADLSLPSSTRERGTENDMRTVEGWRARTASWYVDLCRA
jgi:hypothetical protein